MIRRAGEAATAIEGFARAFFGLPNPCQTEIIYTTHHTTRTYRYFVDWIFPVFTQETHVAQTTRRSMGVTSCHKEGLTTAEICRKTGFDRPFVTRCISKYNDSVHDAELAGRPRKLSTRVERTGEKNE